ncbi:DUF4386 domain-containing protein [Nocardia africana]
MGTTAPAQTQQRAGDTMRYSALVAGVLYLVTFVTSIPTLLLYEPVLDHTDFVLGAGDARSALWGAFLEVVLALSCVGTAVALFPVARRYSETAAIGFVSSRVLEAGLILVGVSTVLSVVTLRQGGTGAGTDSASLITAGRTLVAVHDATFPLGQSLMPVLNALFLGSVLYRSGLVPRIIPLVGFVGAPLLLASDIAILFGAYAQGTPLAGLAAFPIALWELSLGMWLAIKGFRLPQPTAPAAQEDR